MLTNKQIKVGQNITSLAEVTNQTDMNSLINVDVCFPVSSLPMKVTRMSVGTWLKEGNFIPPKLKASNQSIHFFT